VKLPITKGYRRPRPRTSMCGFGGRCRGTGGKRMYRVVFWAGIGTLVAWTAFSAYSALTFL
jgi:hypothetical protein